MTTTTANPAPPKPIKHKAVAATPQELILGALLLAELLIFSVTGSNFFTTGNLIEVTRFTTELGLIALALTPVIVTGGIDLSVGSMLGLSAVVFGKLWRDGHFPIPLAILGALVTGGLGGLLNASIITKLRVHPLIVTLGTFLMFRGIAQGMTGGIDTFTHFPDSFLLLGNGSIAGVPNQAPIFILAAIAFYILLHRSTLGRAWSAIGFSPEGARYAGIPVAKRVALTYVFTGVCSALAAVIYVSRFGQAKADAGMGYELAAITAVVLGGTSIFGGRGSIIGTLLGLFVIAILKNGLRLSDLPPEAADVLSGLLLLFAIGLDRWLSLNRNKPAVSAAVKADEELDMRNTQMAVLCTVILVAAIIIAATNFSLIKSLQHDLNNHSGGSSSMNTTGGGASGHKAITIGMMPKQKGSAYFIACRKGADEAAAQLGDTLLWDGPTDTDPAKQNEIVETWITRGVDVIAVAVENSDGLSTSLIKARQHGIKVVTWDADAAKDARDFFVNQATPQGIGSSLMDNVAKQLNGSGEYAIITASLTAANQNEWIKYIKARQAEKYPNIKLAEIRASDDIPDKALNESKAVLNADPNVKVLLAISTIAVPAAGEAVKQSGRTDVKVVGLGLPNENKAYVHSGITPAVILWNTMDLGYLAVEASDAAANGTLKAGATSFDAGRLGHIEVKGDQVMLGQPYVFDQNTIDKFDF